MPLVLIPLIPVAAFVVLILIGRRLGKASAIVSIAASAAAMLLSIQAVGRLLAGESVAQSLPWLGIGSVPLDWGFRVDPLAAVMLLVVTVIGTLIQIYSTGYMADDARFSRFFAYLSLFTGSMLGLVLADNFVVLYLGWELVGLCSYLLIGFWFEKPSAANAGKKAFITTRIGDCGMAIGIWMLFALTGRTDFASLEGSAHLLAPGVVTAIALFLFAGAIGKSAQFPLHVWLPDAMEGPTPVSALIHAATMVAAGVYMVARCEPLLAASPAASMVVATVGTFTACFAATMALVATDIKKVLAYSTISQLGYMIMAQGVGAMEAGMFHLVTHACFKALLFLAAGSVILGTHHEQDMRKMGGLLKTMPVTGWTCFIAALAISGVPPLAGFWSKDEILVAAWHGGHPVITIIGLITAGLTAFYMFRMIGMTFFGRYRGHHHPHESPAVMTVPLAILAFFSIVVGFPGSPFMHHAFPSFLAGHPHHPPAAPGLMLASVAVALTGIGIAWACYVRGWQPVPARVKESWQGVYQLLVHNYWMDELYGTWIVQPTMRLAEQWRRFDERIVDGAVNGAGVAAVWLSRVKQWVDQALVDGAVNGAAVLVRWSGGALRQLQTGFVQHYLLVVMVGAVAIAAATLLTR